MLLIVLTATLSWPNPAPAEGPAGEEPRSIPFFDRELALRGRLGHLTLSRERGLETRFETFGFYLRAGCRLYLDGVHFREDKNRFTENSFGLRTFMIEADGTIGAHWDFRLSLGGLTQGGQFDGSQAFLDDAYAAYTTGHLRWLIGQHTEPFGLENKTSGLALTFMERSLPNALATGNTVGLSVTTTAGRWFLDTGLFGKDLAESRDVSSNGLGWSGRFAFFPEQTKKKMAQLGLSLSWRGGFDLTDDNTSFVRSRPEAGITNVRFVNTGDLPGNRQIVRAGLEGALLLGPFSMQAEYIRMFLDRTDGQNDLTFEGWYAYASWFPFGGSRKYDSRKALFVYPDVRSSWGDLEVAVRYSLLNLNDGLVRGGKERNWTFGLNWYLTPKTRIMANYVLVFNDQYADDNGSLIGSDQPQIFQMRLQWRF